MKTVDTDIASFLRRNVNLEIRMHFDGKRFHVKSPSIEQHAAYLSDALDHTAEEYRRRANDMEPIRDDGKGKAGGCVKAPAAVNATATTSTANPGRIQFSVTFAPPPIVPMCPKCSKLPTWGNGATANGLAWSWHCGHCANDWDQPVSDGDVIVFHGSHWKFDATSRALFPVTP